MKSTNGRRWVYGSLGLLTGAVLSCSHSYSDSLPASSVLLTKHVNKAADYYEKGDYERAKDEFRAVIGFAPNSVEPYEGLLECSERTKDWPQVAFAAEKIKFLCPECTKLYEYEYGTALFNLNRYDEALPHLKSALATADVPVPVYKPMKLASPEDGNSSNNLLLDGIQKPQASGSQSPQNGSMPEPSRQGHLTDAEREMRELNNKVTSDSSLDVPKLANFENAIRSEFIGIAEYQSYDKSDDIRFNSPPTTHWHIDKILKGPPLNRALPLRYDLHTPDVKEQPADWHFDESKLPKKGSKWILFIESAVPEGSKKLFKTFDGSYGRQPATEKNLNELDRLLEEHNMRNQGL